MATTLYFVQNDTLPQIKLELVNETTQAPRDLSNTTVKLWCKPTTGSGIKFGRESLPEVNAGDNTSGIAFIQWQSGDLNRAPGDYTCEVELLDNVTGSRETIYETIKLVLREDIGDIPPVSTEPTDPY